MQGARFRAVTGSPENVPLDQYRERRKQREQSGQHRPPHSSRLADTDIEPSRVESLTMARLNNKEDILRALFAKSGNVCAFPGCNEEMVTSRNIYVGQICHIEAANPGAPRYNIASNDEERRSFENLMLMCYRHHRETDDEAAYGAQSLTAMKREHELLHGQKPFKVNEAFLFQIVSEMDRYWSAISEANVSDHVIPEFAVPISVGTAASEQFSDVYRSMERLRGFLSDLCASDTSLDDEIRRHMSSLGYDLASYDSVPYYKNPFSNRNWEIHFLAITNTCTDIFVALKQTEVRFLEEYVKTHSSDSSAVAKLDSAKAELHKIAISAGYVD